MSDQNLRLSLLEVLYHEYQVSQQLSTFIGQVSRAYTVGTLEALSERGSRITRRAAVVALGQLAGYSSNHPLGRALQDDDRGVRLAAEEALRSVWCRAGTEDQRFELQAVIEANSARRYHESIARATALIHAAPSFAEAWNQRAVAWYGLGNYPESIADCNQALEINPYHFGAASGIGQCYLQLGRPRLALESFRRALALNPNLEGVRANIASLERTLGKKK
ncbi:MAG TPA: tetratricopeptide repeat protein [Pirellulales bacterium]|nr:tetratricopeptide repeat protein [Pirellulales bacterium]